MGPLPPINSTDCLFVTISSIPHRVSFFFIELLSVRVHPALGIAAA